MDIDGLISSKIFRFWTNYETENLFFTRVPQKNAFAFERQAFIRNLSDPALAPCHGCIFRRHVQRTFLGDPQPIGPGNFSG